MRAFAGYPHRLHYAIKANSTLAVVRRLRALGAARRRQLRRRDRGRPARRLRARRDRLHGRRQDARRARAGRRRSGVARDQRGVARRGRSHRRDRRARTARARAWPCASIRTSTPAATRTFPPASRATKFGMSVDDARAHGARHGRAGRISQVVGLHVHVGSQITTTRAARAAPPRRSPTLARELVRAGRRARAPRPRRRARHRVRAGPGRRARLRTTRPPCCPPSRRPGSTLVLEPGRWIVGPAGVLVTEVVDLKRRPSGGWFVIVDAGMTDLLRPALYGAWHAIEPVAPRPGRRSRVDVVGPVCETTDTLGARPRRCRRSRSATCWPIRDTGAYGAVMASNYNRRPMAAEVLVDRTDVARRPPPPDRRRHAAVGRVMLIAFEGLDQSGKETQARHAARPARAGRPQGQPAVVSRLRARRSARRSRRPCTASASSVPT